MMLHELTEGQVWREVTSWKSGLTQHSNQIVLRHVKVCKMDILQDIGAKIR